MQWRVQGGLRVLESPLESWHYVVIKLMPRRLAVKSFSLHKLGVLKASGSKLAVEYHASD